METVSVKNGIGTAAAAFSKIDRNYVIALLAVAAVPLILLDRNPTQPAWVLRIASLVGYVGLGLAWSWTTARRNERGHAPFVSLAPPSPGLVAARCFRALLTPLLLFALAWLVYFEPLRLHFWGGFDEHVCFQPLDFSKAWLDPPGGRPLLFFPMQALGQALTPDRIEGFLWIGLALWFLNALLLKAILDRLFPEQPMIGTLAAVLFIANRAEPLRYMFTWSAHAYLRPLFWYLLATWLLLTSRQRGSRGLLVLSTLALTVSLLTSEGVFPLAALSLFLLLLSRRHTTSRAPWVALWSGMIGILSARFVLFQIVEGSRSYQSRQLLRGFRDTASLWNSLSEKFSLTWSWIEELGIPEADHLYRRIPVFVLVAAALSWSARSGRTPLRRVSLTRLSLGLLIALVAILFALIPFLHIEKPYRTQFFAAPAHAAVFALAFVIVTRWVPGRLSAVIPALFAGFLVGDSAVRSLKDQAQPQPIHFAKTVHVYNQIHGIAPRYQPGTMLVLVLEDQQRPSLSYVNYHVRKLSNLILGVNAGQANFKDPLGEDVTFTGTGVTQDCGKELRHYRYDQLVAFQMRFDGTLTLLEKLPNDLIPVGARSNDYNPTARMIAGPITPLRYLRRPSWLAPIRDVFESREGVLLGQGWRDRKYSEGSLRRAIDGEATFFVNPQQARSVTVRVSVESAADTVVALRDANGNVLAATQRVGPQVLRAEVQAHGRGPIRLTLGCVTTSIAQPRVLVRAIHVQ